jgi:hypothetical protein
MDISKILMWAWENGVEVSIRSYEQSSFGGGAVRYPMLVFTHEDKHTQISGRDWNEIRECFLATYKRIFAELKCVPPKNF